MIDIYLTLNTNNLTLIRYSTKFKLSVIAYVWNIVVRPMEMAQNTPKCIQTYLHDKDAMVNLFDIKVFYGPNAREEKIFYLCGNRN